MRDLVYFIRKIRFNQNIFQCYYTMYKLAIEISLDVYEDDGEKGDQTLPPMQSQNLESFVCIIFLHSPVFCITTHMLTTSHCDITFSLFPSRCFGNCSCWHRGRFLSVYSNSSQSNRFGCWIVSLSFFRNIGARPSIKI
jgi:hypothetical protein